MKEIALGVAHYFGQPIKVFFFLRAGLLTLNSYLICKRGEMNNQHLLTLNLCMETTQFPSLFNNAKLFQ